MQPNPNHIIQHKFLNTQYSTLKTLSPPFPFYLNPTSFLTILPEKPSNPITKIKRLFFHIPQINYLIISHQNCKTSTILYSGGTAPSAKSSFFAVQVQTKYPCLQKLSQFY